MVRGQREAFTAKKFIIDMQMFHFIQLVKISKWYKHCLLTIECHLQVLHNPALHQEIGFLSMAKICVGLPEP